MVKAPVRRKIGEAGQAVVLVVAAMSIFLLGAVGIAIDASQLYAQRQMAQSAADAAATAGINSIFNGSSTVSSGDCATTSTSSPCVYAHTNGFGTTSGTGADTVTVDTNPGVAVCSGSSTCNLDAGTPNEVQVTITRPVSMTLTKFIGLPSYSIKARATAAILDILSPIPILVLDPNLMGAFSANGGGGGCAGTSCAISIFGGPSTSIQVNSGSGCSVSGNAGTCASTSQTVDLSHAGPNGQGADFADIGGPGSYPGTLLLGSEGNYDQPVGFFNDPLASMGDPPKPTTNLTTATFATENPGQGDCPSDLSTRTSLTTCRIYSPGYYDQGIDLGGSTKAFAIFRPGIYYINHNGFQLTSNSIARMATSSYNGYNTDPNTGTGWTSGMLIYNYPGVDGSTIRTNKDFISIDANAGQINNYSFPNAAACGTDSSGNAIGGNCLVGANGGVLTGAACADPATAAAMYYGVLFFQNRSVGASLTHTLSGGGGLSVKGTIYLHDPTSSYAYYQTLNLQGTSGSSTKVEGEIIVDALGVGGTSGITMNLSTLACYKVRKIALIQ